jgi:hypothetical protein
MPEMKPQTPGGGDAKWLLWAGGAIAAVLLVIPATVGAAVFLPLRGRLKRLEWIVLLVGALLALGVAQGLGWYLSWVGATVQGKDGGGIPLAQIFAAGLALSATAGLLDGTAVGAKIPKLWGKKAGKIGDRPQLIPTDLERERISVVAPPVMTPDAASHTVSVEAKPGTRPFPIGVDRFGRPFHLTEKEIETHALIFGATGSGKSVTIQVVAAGLMDLGWSGMLLDLKEDTKPGGLRDWCSEYASAHSMPYQELRLSDENPGFWFDPLSGLNQDEARDAILSLTKFDDEYYKNVCKAVLGQLLNLMYLANQVDPAGISKPTIAEISRILASASIPAATKKLRAVVAHAMPHVDIDNTMRSMVNPSKVEQDQAASWGFKLGNVIQTRAGSLVLSPSPNRRMLDVTAPGLIYIGLDSQGKQDLTKMVSSAVLQRISADAAQRTTGANTQGMTGRKFLIVDEANWVDRTITQNLLSRARSAGISMILCTQGPMDWIDKEGDDFAKLAQNTNVAIFMRQGEPRAAEMCADYIGKAKFMDVTFQQRDDEMMNSGSVRENEDHIVSPDELRNLRIGEAVIRVGAPATRMEWVKVIQRSASVGTHQVSPMQTPAGRKPIVRPPFG